MNIRDRLVEIATSFAGVDVSTARDRYLSLVAGPGDTAPEQRAYLTAPKTSGCALVVRGLWRLASLPDRRLSEKYRPGLAVGDVVAIARQHGAWVTNLEALPMPGDVVLVGDNSTGGVEHVATITAVRPDGTLESVDGGQRDAHGQQAIRAKVRTWERRGDGSVWDRARLASDPGGGSARVVRGFVDVGRLPWPDVASELAPPTPVNHGGTPLPARPTLRRGDKGAAVGELQRCLRITVDQDFGVNTERAVKIAQKAHGLVADGIAGPKTWAALDG